MNVVTVPLPELGSVFKRTRAECGWNVSVTSTQKAPLFVKSEPKAAPCPGLSQRMGCVLTELSAVNSGIVSTTDVS